MCGSPDTRSFKRVGPKKSVMCAIHTKKTTGTIAIQKPDFQWRRTLMLILVTQYVSPMVTELAICAAVALTALCGDASCGLTGVL